MVINIVNRIRNARATIFLLNLELRLDMKYTSIVYETF